MSDGSRSRRTVRFAACWGGRNSNFTNAVNCEGSDREAKKACRVSNLQNRADSVIFRRRVYGFSETPASVSWYDGVAKRPDTDQDNKDVGDVAEGDTIHILAPYSRRTSSLARRCDGRSAERASPAIRQRARPGSDRDVPAKLARTCRAPTRRACGPGAQLHCQGGVQPADHLPADRH